MAPKQKTKDSTTNLSKQAVTEKSKKPAQEPDTSSKPNANPSKTKSWTSLSPAEKTEWATHLFVTTGAWKTWSEGLQKEFLKSVEQTKGSSGFGARKSDSELDLGRDRNGRRIADYSAEEFEAYKERRRELAQLKRESWEFRERGFVARESQQRSRTRVEGEEKELVSETVSISEAEIEEERRRRKRMAILEERRESDVGTYSGDPVWDDVVPLVQEESLGGLASIAYTEEYAEAMSYLRAVMSTSEHSPRILHLTSHIISLNPAHYTVWLYRTQTLFALDSDLQRELEWLNEIALANQKNYQIWHHRQLIIDHLYPKEKQNTSEQDDEWNTKTDALVKKEFAFMNEMLEEDSKNYHVWSHRQWFIRHLDLFSFSHSTHINSELDYTHNLITSDLRNNSAYSHRFFLVFNNPEYCTPDSKPTETDERLRTEKGKEIVDREIEWVKGWILEAPENASSWGYLRGILRKAGTPLSNMACFVSNFVDLGDDEDDKSKESQGVKEGKENIKSSHALEFMADIWSGDVGEGVVGGGEKRDLRRAERALGLLRGKYDPIRRNYWEWRREGLSG